MVGNNGALRSLLKADNGLNPSWNGETCTFDILNPDTCLVRFLVQDEDMFGDHNFLGQATYPLPCLRTGSFVFYLNFCSFYRTMVCNDGNVYGAGFRSIQLKNEHSEELEMSSLLVHIQIEKVHNFVMICFDLFYYSTDHHHCY